MKDVEYEERIEDVGSIKMGNSACDFEGRKLPRGIKNLGNGRWRARVWHPKLKFSFWIGNYSSLEEAATAINKKKAEFRESCGDEYEGKKLPFGVRRRGYRRWQAQITHPILKIRISLGCYDSLEEASMAMNMANAELKGGLKCKGVKVETCGQDLEKDQWDSAAESYECENKVQPSGEGLDMADNVSREVDHDLVALKDRVSDCEINEGTKWKEYCHRVPFGVRLNKGGMWDAWAAHPLTFTKHLLPSCKFFEEAVSAAIRKRAEFDESYGATNRIKFGSEATDKTEKLLLGYGCSSSVSDPDKLKSTSIEDKPNNAVANAGAVKRKRAVSPANRNRAKFGGLFKSRTKVRPEFEPTAVAENSESDFCNGRPTSVVGTKSFDYFAAHDNWSYRIDDGPKRLYCDDIHCSPTSLFYPQKISGLDIHDGSQTPEENLQINICASNFEEAVGLGFINEYGQLLGEYTMLDEQMELSFA